MLSFSAALLAGGKSTRMGQDKALLPLPPSGLLLWQRQLQVLEDLQPDEIFWSGFPRPGLPSSLRIVADKVPDAGPLAGIVACLGLMQTDLLVVLAIDLPQMSSSLLKDFLKQCSPSRGVVMHNGDFFEPLAAIYPKCIQAIAQEHLDHGRYALQDLLRKAVAEKMLLQLQSNETTLPLFRNWNSKSFGGKTNVL